MTYEEAAGAAARRFAQALEAAEAEVRRLGGRFLPAAGARACADEAARAVAVALPDAALLAVCASRPTLLDLDERAGGGWKSPREALREALAAALSDGLSGAACAAVEAGQDTGTLDAVAGEALDALEGLARSGRRYPLIDEARAVLASGAWDGDAAALALHACAFLDAAGRTGLALDLEAALDAREAVAAPPGGPARR